MSSGVEIRGSSLAALVCADVLARQGTPVRLVADLATAAASFRFLDIDGVKVEVGARLLELDYGDPDGGDLDPRGYQYGDHRAHIGLVAEYIRGLVTPAPAAVWIARGAEVSPDFLLTSNLHYLQEATSSVEQGAIHREARALVRAIVPTGIPRDRLQLMTYREASLACHGFTFHRLFIEPLLDLILGTGDLPALDHRRVWLPLFRPVEILDAVEGRSRRPRRQVFTGMGAAVEALLARVEPLLEARLPAGRVSVVADTPRRTVAQMSLRLVWARQAGLSLPDVVVWTPRGTAFRQTQIGRVRCWEMRGGSAREFQDVLADRTLTVSLAELGTVDPETGRIGMGSFNEQIAQGIAAAAWRMG